MAELSTIRLRVLGEAGLVRRDGVEVQSVLAQPKRFALLVYLTLAAPGQYHRRDSLVAFFWPEANTDHARGSLRSSLYFLRRSLGDEVVETRGDEVRLTPGAVWCDVVAFEDALRGARPDAALELYRGQLLPGFALVDTPPWDDWLDRERARLARGAAGAAGALAERARGCGDAVAAVEWARRAVALSPTEEPPVRALMDALDWSGARADALRVYEAFAARVQQELGAAPAPETRRLAEAILQREAALGPAASPAGPTVAPESREGGLADGDPASGTPPGDAVVASAPPTAPAVPPALAPGAAPLPPHVRPRRSRKPERLAMAAAAFLLIVGSTSGGGPAPVGDAATTPARDSRVAVLPFSVRGPEGSEYLGAAMTELLSSTLDGAGDLRAVDPRAVLASTPEGELAPEAAQSAAARLDARYYLTGAVVVSGEEMRVTASLFDRAQEGRAVAVARARGPAREVFGLVDGLTADLLAEHAGRAAGELDRKAAHTTRSLPALKLYLSGRRAMREGRLAAAVDLLTRAVDADSTFALALYALFDASDAAAKNTPETPHLLERALRHAAHLGEADRLLIVARGYGHVQPERSEPLYWKVLAMDPTNFDALSQLSDLTFHTGPARGHPFTASREGFERVLALEPNDAAALEHLARIAAWEGRTAAADSLTRRALSRLPDGEVKLDLLALRAAALGDAGARAQVLAELERTADQRTWYIGWRAAIYSGHPAAAAPLLARLTDRSRSPVTRALGHVALAQVALAGGRRREAAEQLRTAEAIRAGLGAPLRPMLAMFPFLDGRCPPGTRAPRAASREALPEELVPRGHVFRKPWFADGVPGGYVEGVLAACRGDYGAALAAARALDGRDSTGAAAAARIRAHVAWAGGPYPPAPVLAPSVVEWGGLFPGAHYRWIHAELLRRAGRPEEALRWYQSIPQDLDYGGIAYYAPAELRQAELLDGLGRRGEAVRHYARFVALWRDADAELRPLVQHARERLAQLGGG